MALIQAGWTYKFKFKQSFHSLDGVYTMAKIYSWAEVINEQIALYDILYAPLNISETQYNEDLKTFKHLNIYKLVSPQTGGIVFAPETIFEDLPLYTVQEYSNLVVFMPIGVHADPEQLDYLVDFLADNITAGVGVLEKPNIVEVGKKYMTEKEYDEMVATRKANVKRVLNNTSALIEAQKTIASQKAKIEALESIIKDKWSA